MSVLPFLILVSFLVAVCFLGAFLWAMKNGQYEDQETPAMRILFDSSDKPTKTDSLSGGQK